MVDENAIADLRTGRIQAYAKLPTLVVAVATASKTAASHLVGASVGREAIVVHLTALAAPFLQAVPGLRHVSFRRLKSALLAVGFGVAVGNPWCALTLLIEKDPRQAKSLGTLWTVGGALVAIQMIRRWVSLPELPLPYLSTAEAFRAAVPPAIESQTGRVFLALMVLTLAGCIAVQVLLRIQRLKLFTRGLLVTLPIAVVYAVVVYLTSAERWVGLGIPVIAESFRSPESIAYGDPAIKLVLTAVSIGLGFFGGEFVPLLFVGSTLGAAIATSFGLGGALLPGIGLYLVYGIAARLPLTTLVLIGGKFGWGILPYSFACVLVSLAFRPREGIFYVRRDGGPNTNDDAGTPTA